jgi:S-adenosylmethionine hydrolase
MSIITLLTDFGEADEFVGVMKGVILGVNPSASIIDITHAIDPQDIVQAAYLIPSYYTFFPKGTVHIIVVDPEVGSDRPIIALEMAGHVFLAPDNGVLSLLLDNRYIDSIVSVNNQNYFLTPVSQTFHGRDIFASVGAHISTGIDVGKTGIPLSKKDLVRLNIQKPHFTDKGKLVGAIISIDRFGNLITNIKLSDVNESFGSHPDAIFQVEVGKRKIVGLSESYQGAGGLSESYQGAGIENLLAIIGSRGYLEIALNRGSAHGHLKVEKGDLVYLSCAKVEDAPE